MFWESFYLTAAVVAGLQYYIWKNSSHSNFEALKTPAFVSFQRNYLLVFLLAMFADWLKGPYVYALYDGYGYDSGEIAMLFIVGFFSSLLVGTIVGGLADKYGRRLMCIAFAVVYFIGGACNWFSNYEILMVGRFLSGVATSLLFSVFESWMVTEHKARGFHMDLLSDTFGKQTLGNGIVAVVAGLVASFAADMYGYVAPFVLCLIPLFLVGVIVWASWNENYGNEALAPIASFVNAWEAIKNDRRILFMGCAQSLYEGAMYSFVFMWTPSIATTDNKATLPYGLIFAVFMVCVMLGSSVFTLMSIASMQVRSYPMYIHVLAIASSAMTFLFLEDKTLVYLSFLIFEFSCGMYFPTYGTLRSIYIPEETRSSITNFFRIPLNAFVVLLLVKVKYLPIETVFQICCGTHFIAFVCYKLFVDSAEKTNNNASKQDQGASSA